MVKDGSAIYSLLVAIMADDIISLEAEERKFILAVLYNIIDSMYEIDLNEVIKLREATVRLVDCIRELLGI
jgi:hypothetical protein